MEGGAGQKARDSSAVADRGKKRLQMSFGGCGFLGVYHIGVGKCVMDHAPHLFDEFERFYGASAGAITAVWAACKLDAMVAYKWVKKTFEASRKYRILGTLHPSMDLYSRVRVFLEETLPVNAHKLTRGKVQISLTKFPSMKNWLVSNFATRKELINAIIASSFIPVYAGLKDFPLFRGKRCMDGGFSSNIPCVSSDNVISVSPFSGGCDICPQGESHSLHLLHVMDQPLQISSSNMTRLARALVPSSWAELEVLFTAGFKDALRFFREEGFIPTAVIRPRRLSLLSVAMSEQLPVGTDTPSEYFSMMSGESSPTPRSRSPSLVVDFLSCLEEEEEGEEEEEEGEELSPDHLELLEEELRRLEAEEKEEREREKESTSSLATKSWSRVSWLLHSCSPAQLPLLGRLAGLVRNHTPSDSSWDDNSEHLKVLEAILSSWPSSMATFSC